MEGPANANAAELPSSPSAAEQLIFNDDRQPIAFYDTQGQMRHLRTEEELSVPMDGTTETPQPSVVYHMEADRDSEAEDIHVTHRPNNTVDFDAGVQQTEINWISSDSESDEGIQQSDDRDKSPMQYNNVGDPPRDDEEAMSNSPPSSNTTDSDSESSGNPPEWILLAMKSQGYNDVHNEQSDVLVDFDEDADVEDEEALLALEEDNEIEEDADFEFGSRKAFIDPQTTQIITQHLSTPNQQSFTTLNDLLSSHNAPGRGLYNIEKVLEREKGRAAELEEKMKYIEAELEEVRAQRDTADETVRKAKAAFRKALSASGIRKDLWKEYEAFCESLEPRFGNRGGWCVTCFEDHNGSYVQWDPELDLFVQSAEIPLGSCNFRCEATKVERTGRTEYVVEFWPLANPEPRVETARTWRQQYPKLYGRAERAARNPSRDNTIVKELLRSLPDPELPFSGGWLFEYALEPGRARHPTLSRRWSYRSACRIPVDRQQDQADSKAQSGSDAVETEDEEMEFDEYEAAESKDVKMEDEESELDGSLDVEMDDKY